MEMDRKEVDSIFVPYDLAFRLKPIGFNKPCIASYWTDIERNILKDGEDMRKALNANFYVCPFDGNIEGIDSYIVNSEKDYYVSAPLWQQAFDWFREDKGYDLHIKPMSFRGVTMYYDVEIQHPRYVWDALPKVTAPTYKDVMYNCLDKLITLEEEI